MFPDEPVGPSKGLGFFAKKEAKRTPILSFKDNSAHSNGNTGLALFRRLSKDHGVIGCSTYSPRVNATDRLSEMVPVIFDGFHGKFTVSHKFKSDFSYIEGYKNRRRNMVSRSTAAELQNFYLSDSLHSLFLVRNMLGGYQRIKNSVIVGESPNVGIVGQRRSVSVS